MSIIHLKVPRYMRGYYEKKFGCPCVFDQRGIIWSHMRLFMQSTKFAKNDREWFTQAWLHGPVVEDGVHYDWLAVKLPSRSEDDHQFEYIGPRGRNVIVGLLFDIIAKHIWNDFTPILMENANVQSVVAGWCEVNGINMEDELVVRQIFYRKRRNLQKKGINLKKSTKNKENSLTKNGVLRLSGTKGTKRDKSL